MEHLQWPFFEDRHRELAKAATDWAAKSIPHDESEPNTWCRSFAASLGQAGWLRNVVISPYGGNSGKLDVRTLCLMREILAERSALADFVFAMQGLGSGPISLFGSHELQERYLRLVSEGKAIAAFALSEYEAGSDVAAIATTATPQGDGFVLNGAKTWISNAGIADFYVVFARTGEAPGAKGLSAFVVDAKAEGVSCNPIDVISPHPLGTVIYKNVMVPKTHRLGVGGDGFKIAMATLDVFRSTVGAAALGLARRALSESLTHSRSRKLFGQALADFQLTQGALASMATEIDASALLIYRAAWTKDSGAERITREAAMAKWYATEAAQRVIDQAVQLHGGRGVVSEAVVERLYRDIRPLRIYEGASEVQQLIIARSLEK